MILHREDPSTKAFTTTITKHRILTRAEERELIRRAQAGDKRAERELVRCNLRLVVKVAGKFQHRGLELDEVITEGAAGLQDAVQRYDPQTGYRFMSYAVWWIRAHITKAISIKGRLIRIGDHQISAVRKYRGLPLEQCIGGEAYPRTAPAEDGEDPFPMQILDRTRTAAETLAPASLDAAITPEGESLAVFLASPDPSPEDWAASQQDADRVSRLLHNLSPLERRILTLLFGIDSGEPMLLREAGNLVGLSHERVRQIRDRALGRLRSRVTNKGGR